MTDGSDQLKSGAFELTVNFDVYGDVESTLAPLGMTLDALVMRAFLEVANASNSFDVKRHTFALSEDKSAPSFTVAARRSEREIQLCISPAAEKPLTDEDLDVIASLFGAEMVSEVTTKH